VDVGDTVIVPLVDLSTPPRVHLSAFVLAHVRVDDCPEVIDAGEVVNDVIAGFGTGNIILYTAGSAIFGPVGLSFLQRFHP
jgi:hypothetical protein